MQILRASLWTYRVGAEGRKRVGALFCWGLEILDDSDELPDEKIRDVVQVGSRLCPQETMGCEPQSWLCEAAQAIWDEAQGRQQSWIPGKDGEFDVEDLEASAQEINFNKAKWKFYYGKVEPHPGQEHQLTQEHF